VSRQRKAPPPAAAGAAPSGTGASAPADSIAPAGAGDSPGRRADAGQGAAPPPAEWPGSLRLPASGLAEEILAGLAAASAAPAPPLPPSPPSPSSITGRDRVYSFADTLELRGQEAAPPPEQPESWVVFELAAERYGLPVAAVQEILRVGTLTRVPHSPAPVRGITSLRGRVLAVVDLRVRLGLPPVAVDARSRILVVDSRQRVLGLLVDAALQVRKLLPSALTPPPADVMTERSDYIRGVYHLEDQLIIALDLDRALLIHDEASPPRPAAPLGEE
jgi:purine-binding chemotaxis protein CheW